jgi:oxygen-independent coproporphyrinogen-3 oxidase
LGDDVTTVEPATTRLDQEATQVGSVFVSNYPPYSFWDQASVPKAHEALHKAPGDDASLGLYVHIPFCRKRCKFCYFRVFTDKNNAEIKGYLDRVAGEVERYAQCEAVAGRPLRFVYFGGGTPSYISAEQLAELAASLQASISWQGAEEVAFECEPGTLTRSKLEVIREIGVTRLSLGVENFDDDILRENGRAHVSTEIYRVQPWIRELDFPQLNIDLIAGMAGETWETWRRTVDRAIAFEPDSVTLYQMELPFNTVYSKGVIRGEGDVEFASWSLKREWHAYAFEKFEEAGYEIWSAYTVLRSNRVPRPRFVYADAVWHGSDMIGAGVASFSHVGGVHFQNEDRWDAYLEASSRGLPIARAFVTTPQERCNRELILQLKTGRVPLSYFAEKFDCDVRQVYREPLERLAAQGMLALDSDEIRLTMPGLLRVDQLLPELYDSRYRDARYT